MNNEPDAAVRGKLAEIFSAVFKRPIEPDDAVTRDREKAWDSLRHVELVFVVEDAFGVTFPPDVAENLGSLNAFAEAISVMAGAAG